MAAAEEGRFTRRKHAVGQRPGNAYKKFFRNHKEFYNQRKFLEDTLRESGFNVRGVNIEWVEHHIAHVASSFYLSGFHEAAIMSIDGGGNYSYSSRICV